MTPFPRFIFPRSARETGAHRCSRGLHPRPNPPPEIATDLNASFWLLYNHINSDLGNKYIHHHHFHCSRAFPTKSDGIHSLLVITYVINQRRGVRKCRALTSVPDHHLRLLSWLRCHIRRKKESKSGVSLLQGESSRGASKFDAGYSGSFLCARSTNFISVKGFSFLFIL